jgi:hypothetical protein
MRKSLGISLVLAGILAMAGQVSAERSRRPPPPQAEPAAPPTEKIAATLGDVQWGWGRAKVISHYEKQLQEAFRPAIAKASDAITEDRLRRDLTARSARIKGSYVEFTGKATGWDTSLIRDQYTHGNGESLVEVREIRGPSDPPRYTDYFFFINDHLWRMYRAFNQDQFQGIPFATAATSFQRRFGAAVEKRSGGNLVGLEWQDDTTRLEAIDNTEFFGVFCLVFSEKATERNLAQLRKNQSAKRGGLSPIVEALDSVEDADRHHDVVEHITGKRYNTSRNQEPVKGEGAAKRPGGKTPPASREPAETPEKRPAKRTGDPLHDLEI